jgi:surfeit locus 1 family protein
MRYSQLITFIIAIIVTLLCSLGVWQISRGLAKRDQLQQWEASHRIVLLKANDLLTHTELERYTGVQLTGHFINENTVLLDNKTNNGRVGYHVITPLCFSKKQCILVDRGWIPLIRSRDLLPEIPPILGEVTIEGYLDFAYRNPLTKQSIENNEIKWPLRVQEIDIKKLATLLDRNIFSMLVKFKIPSSYSFEIPPFKGSRLCPERHYGYAVQWFLLAITLAVLYHRGKRFL